MVPDASQIKWLVVELVQGLPASSVEVAMEPSGTYGDPLRALLIEKGIAVYRVSPNHVHAYAEIHDGVPRKHDPKDAEVVGCLHLDGKSKLWLEDSPEKRELAAAARLLDLTYDQHQQSLNQLESLLARHWPEALPVLALGTATLQELLIEYGDPRRVAADPEGARGLMRRVGRSLLKEEKIEALLASAGTTTGVPMVAGERTALQTIAREARRSSKAARGEEAAGGAGQEGARGGGAEPGGGYGHSGRAVCRGGPSAGLPACRQLREGAGSEPQSA